MHKNFGEWYRRVSIPCTDEILRRRWAGVEKWAATVHGDVALLLETVRIFRGLPARSSREAYLEAFRQQDAAFAQRDNNYEQQLLAGAALVHCISTHDKTDENSVRIALIAGAALEASSFRAHEDRLEELALDIRLAIHEISRQQRRRRGVDNVLLSDEEEAALKKAIETNVSDPNQLRASFASAFQTLLTAVNRSEAALYAAAHDLRCADEETNILWWLAGRSSRDLDRPWSSLKDGAPLVVGWELADLTDVALGPHDAGALLERALPEAKGGKSKELALHVYVNAVPEDWAKSRTTNLDGRALDLTPLAFALTKRAEAGSTAWQPFFESASGLKVANTLTPERVARLAYVEAVLFRTLANTGN